MTFRVLLISWARGGTRHEGLSSVPGRGNSQETVPARARGERVGLLSLHGPKPRTFPFSFDTMERTNVFEQGPLYLYVPLGPLLFSRIFRPL